MSWLEDWEKEVSEVPELSAGDRAKSQLSNQTIEGWKITIASFTELSRQLIDEGYEFVLSERLVCQDSLEQHFSHTRASCGSNSMPTLNNVYQIDNIQAVARNIRLTTTKGNPSRSASIGALSDAPLVKRKK